MGGDKDCDQETIKDGSYGTLVSVEMCFYH